MHRVKKVAFRTRLQSGLSPRVYNHHFFTRNNSLLDLKRQCRTKVDERESGMSPTVLPQFPSTGPTLMSCPRWYTRSAFPVPTHLLFHLVHQKHVSCTNTSLIPFGTPEVRFLYQCAPVYSVHAKASSRTFSVLWNNRRPVLPGMKNHTRLKQHSLDN